MTIRLPERKENRAPFVIFLLTQLSDVHIVNSVTYSAINCPKFIDYPQRLSAYINAWKSPSGMRCTKIDAGLQGN